MPHLRQKDVILVDDGVATGYTLQAAILALKQLEPQSIMVAVPVIAVAAIAQLQRLATQVVYLKADANLSSVGASYEDFVRVEDEEVIRLLAKSQNE